MVLTKDELSAALWWEVHLLQHLMTKVDPAMLDYRPTPKQRSMLEVLQYLALFGPIQMRGALTPGFTMDEWMKAWKEGDEALKAQTFEQLQETIAKQPEQYAETLKSTADETFREQLELFGHKDSRGAWAVKLVLNHYAAYRMQLFLYLKASGREELNTMNLWAGVDGQM